MKYKYVEMIEAVSLFNEPTNNLLNTKYTIEDGLGDKAWTISIKKEGKDFIHYVPKTNIKNFTELLEEKPKLKIKPE